MPSSAHCPHLPDGYLRDTSIAKPKERSVDAIPGARRLIA
jgi:hypothetical protein